MQKSEGEIKMIKRKYIEHPLNRSVVSEDMIAPLEGNLVSADIVSGEQLHE